MKGQGTMRKPIVLVVTEDATAMRWTRAELMKEGITVLTASSLEEALDRADTELYDLVLSIGFPDKDPGLDRLEMKAIAPILSSPDSFEADPPGELIDVVYGMLPRRFQNPEPVLNYGDLVIELGAGRVLERGYSVKLRQPEYRLLMTLARDAGETLSVDELLLRVWGPAYRGRHQLLRTTVSRLREQLEIKRQLPEVITTVPGRGYRLELPETVASQDQGSTR